MKQRKGGPAEGAWSVWQAKVGPGVDRILDEALPPSTEKPTSIHRAMRHAVFPGGKRIRPALAALGYEAAGGRGDAGLRLGAAIELIHTFSLIHDDLPAMDDDDYRRGRLTVHRKFGEAVGVLAGDALQVIAFEQLARLPVPPARRLRVLEEITAAAGTRGVIGGQVVDIESEGRKIPFRTLRWMHERKTGALLRAALCSGALLAGGRKGLFDGLAEFGAAFGLLFQITDDLMDEVGSYRHLGRRRGRDRVRGKATYPTVLGRDRSRIALAGEFEQALTRIPLEGEAGETLVDLIGLVVGRLPDRWLPDSKA